MSMHAPKIWQLWHTAGSDFIKTNHQFHIKTLRKLHNIFIKIGTLCEVLSFNICLFTCCYAHISLTNLTHPASTLLAYATWKVIGTSQKPTLEPSWNFKFLDETKTAIHSKHLHTNVTEMYGKRKYVEINDNKAKIVSWNFTVMARFLSADMQTLSRPEA